MGNVADAAHDTAVAFSALGLAPGAWRGLDAIAASLLAAAPLGTRAARAGMAQAIVIGAAGRSCTRWRCKVAAAVGDGAATRDRTAGPTARRVEPAV